MNITQDNIIELLNNELTFLNAEQPLVMLASRLCAADYEDYSREDIAYAIARGHFYDFTNEAQLSEYLYTAFTENYQDLTLVDFAKELTLGPF